jgi:hypothetical protein
MHLAVFLARRVAQVHGPASERTATPLPRAKVGTTRVLRLTQSASR